MSFVPHLIALSLTVPPEIEDYGPEGDAARAEFGLRAEQLNTQQYAAGGLNFGYFYDDSPLISYDDESRAALHDGRLHAVDRPRRPRAARVAGRRRVVV